MVQQNPNKQELANKQKQLNQACQKFASDLKKQDIDPEILEKDCEEICKIGHECEDCCKKIK